MFVVGYDTSRTSSRKGLYITVAGAQRKSNTTNHFKESGESPNPSLQINRPKISVRVCKAETESKTYALTSKSQLLTTTRGSLEQEHRDALRLQCENLSGSDPVFIRLCTTLGVHAICVPSHVHLHLDGDDKIRSLSQKKR